MYLPPLPLQLTDEEINEILQLPSPSIPPPIPDRFRREYNTYEYGWIPKSYVRHEWKPILLLTSTVYNCSKCGAKQEEAKDAYCQDEAF